ncbi:hypothetical protein ACHAXR_003708, partial [Thalassiosira sp. AJA248-18]
TALFYLWVRSGFSKGSVAGALTFFPPDPPLYKFQRVGKDGDELPDADDEDNGDNNNVGGVEAGGEEKQKDGGDYYDDDDDDSDLGTFEIDTNSSHQTNNNRAQNNNNTDEDARQKKQRQKQRQQKLEAQQQQQREAASQDPIVAMTERSNKLRQRAKRRARIDSADAKNGVTYKFVPDLDVLGDLPSFHGTVHPVKIGPQKRTGTYVAALLYKLPPSECTPTTKTILYSHGNATDVGAMAGLQCLIAKNIKCHVLVYDYSGYGESGGVPMEKNTYRDVKMVYEWVVKNVTQHESNVILYGQSVGSGPSCYLASRRDNVGGLVLHSPFTSGMRVLTPSRALACLDIFPNIDRIKKVKCPVFIIHGKKDMEVVWEHGVALQAAVPEDCQTDPWWVPEKGHNDIVDGPMIVEYIQRLNRFVRSLDD